VVGGGVSGLTAALEAAKTGYDVLLVEKTGSLGGWAAKLAKRVPNREPYANPMDTGIAEMAKKVEADKRINCTQLDHHQDQRRARPVQRRHLDRVRLDQHRELRRHHHGLGLHALRHEQAAAPRCWQEQGRGRPARSRGADEGRQRRADQAPERRQRGKERGVYPVRRQRSDKEGELPYCSGHCCNTSVKQAMYFKDQNPAIERGGDVHRPAHPGNGEDFYRSARRRV